MLNCIRCNQWLDPSLFLSKSRSKLYKACASCRAKRALQENIRLGRVRDGTQPQKPKSTPPPTMHHPADEVLGGDSSTLFALRRPLIETKNDNRNG